MLFRILTISFLLLCASAQAGEIKIKTEQTKVDIRWMDNDGKIHHLEDSTGKPRLLHFWAAWCFPCRKELPEMLVWQKEHPDIVVIPLSLDERIAQTQYFITKYNLDMPALLANEDDHEKLDIQGLPFTIFVRPDGTASGHYFGAAPWQSEAFTEQVRSHFNTK